MEALTAGIVLAWVVLTVLTFAMAGLLHQLRAVQATLNRQSAASSAPAIPQRELLGSVRPRANKRYAAALLVDEQCPICAEVAPIFADLAANGPDDLDFILLSTTESKKWQAGDHVRQLADPRAYQLLDPGWRPAIAVLNAEGEVLAIEPASSAGSVQGVIDDIAGAWLAGR